jgi:hypothetical protein
LRLEELESRNVPSIVIQFDYSFDTSGFFNDPGRRAILQKAANDLAGHLDADLTAIVPGGANNWSESFYNPGTGQLASVANPVVAANTLVVYAGGREFGGSVVGEAGPGTYWATATQG